MGKHSHDFVEEYNGLVGFGLDRETDEHTLTYYLQKFSDDENIALLRERMSETDLRELFDLLTRLLKQYLSEEEYHRVFLKDDTP
ncbi:MAG: cytoplasmic protein [Deltaproteobacteria bacterium]|nr:cytoplasmic protein [Deltaproteobacteria bacterium]